MNRLIIIGNGFDLAHDLETSYKDFVNWYWRERINSLITDNTNFSDDGLCELKIIGGTFGNWSCYMYNNHEDKRYADLKCKNSFELIEHFEKTPNLFEVKIAPFFNVICRNIENKGWVDIEIEYYKKLISCNPDDDKHISALNMQLQKLQDKLEQYLKTQSCCNGFKCIERQINSKIDINDISLEGLEKVQMDIECKSEVDKWRPDKTLLLSFNYTQTARLYAGARISINHIHGNLDTPSSIIFGYGDDKDSDYEKLQKSNNNMLLDYIKSFRYLENDNYRELLNFLENAPFQVFIMGHSCGTSDGTLLNTIFEHDNCVSIKPFFYTKENGHDNYRELVQNISRSFTSSKRLRDRVVNKTRCEALGADIIQQR